MEWGAPPGARRPPLTVRLAAFWQWLTKVYTLYLYCGTKCKANLYTQRCTSTAPYCKQGAYCKQGLIVGPIVATI